MFNCFHILNFLSFFQEPDPQEWINSWWQSEHLSVSIFCEGPLYISLKEGCFKFPAHILPIFFQFGCLCSFEQTYLSCSTSQYCPPPKKKKVVLKKRNTPDWPTHPNPWDWPVLDPLPINQGLVMLNSLKWVFHRFWILACSPYFTRVCWIDNRFTKILESIHPTWWLETQ